jgi:CubicO group peptidase (beta-lactamase class C family)
VQAGNTGRLVGATMRWALLVGGIVGLALLSVSHPGLGSAAAARQEVRATGTAVPGMAAYDRAMADLMAEHQIPGGAVAVVKDGRLVFARGYGLADVEAGRPVQPDSLFRIASNSKAFTAAAVLKLVEQGRLRLDTRAFSVLGDLQPPPGAATDPRIATITVEQLLHHTAGWDREKTFDPMFRSAPIATAVGAPAPASCATIIRYMLGQPLDFDPGTRVAYSNLGYCILAQIIQQVSGQSYESFVREQLLVPSGIQAMRLGSSLMEGRAAGEVRYYAYPGAPLEPSVFPEVPGRVPAPDGGFYLEAMAGNGGWIASTIDLLRFVVALDRGTPTRILQPDSLRLMLARPPPPVSAEAPVYYGMGWLVRPVRADANWWHNGSLPGTSAYMARYASGVAVAALLNSRPRDFQAFVNQFDRVLSRTVGEVTEWPSHDLFGDYR